MLGRGFPALGSKLSEWGGLREVADDELATESATESDRCFLTLEKSFASRGSEEAS